MKKKLAVFLDRDGTINEDVGYPNHFNQVNIYPSSFEAVRKINKAGFLAVIMTNQSGIGRGFITEEQLQVLHQKIEAAFAKHQARFDGIYYCPHYQLSSVPLYRKDCSCRKPNPGLALQAASELNIDLESSYMIGDKVEDMLFGWNINASPILVLTGFGQKSLSELKQRCAQPVFVAQHLLEAVNWILKREKIDLTIFERQ
jgi:D-glycero-D-manno-heptose 1,7-bisphosphate phosphatase